MDQLGNGTETSICKTLKHKNDVSVEKCIFNIENSNLHVDAIFVRDIATTLSSCCNAGTIKLVLASEDQQFDQMSAF